MFGFCGIDGRSPGTIFASGYLPIMTSKVLAVSLKICCLLIRSALVDSTSDLANLKSLLCAIPFMYLFSTFLRVLILVSRFLSAKSLCNFASEKRYHD